MNKHSNNQSPSVKLFENLITIDQLSEWIQVPEKTIRDWVYKRKIPFRKVGNHVRFLRSEIELWIQKGEPNAR